jgi:hypothetical protein
MAEPGWYPDPARRHEYRYHDGGVWTAHVADRGTAGADPLPPVAAQPESETSPAIAADESFKKLGRWADRRMQHAAAWLADRGGNRDSADGMPVLDHEPSPEVLGQWSGLARAVQKYTVATSGIAGGAELVGVLQAVAGSEDAQGRLLRSIDAKVDALVKGPYNTGRTYLRDAQRLGPDDPQTVHRLERARDAFYLAHGQAVSVQSRALVEYHLGLAWLLLGVQDDAVHWLAQSHASALAVVEELARCSKNVKVLRSQAGTAAAVWFYPAGVVVAGMKFRKMVAAQRARSALVEMLPFVDCTARCHNCLVAETHRLGALELVSTGDDTFELVPVAL